MKSNIIHCNLKMSISGQFILDGKTEKLLIFDSGALNHIAGILKSFVISRIFIIMIHS